MVSCDKMDKCTSRDLLAEIASSGENFQLYKIPSTDAYLKGSDIGQAGLKVLEDRYCNASGCKFKECPAYK